VLPWRDMLHDGPVPAGLGLEALSAERARFLAGCFGLDPAAVLAEFQERDARLRGAIAEGAAFVLWFEHDLYDQLQLVQVLSALAEAGVPAGRIGLVQADEHLGETTPEALAGLPRRAVTAAQLALAAQAWAAFRAPTPQGLVPLQAGPTAALPWLGPAIARLLEELPAPGSGLSRTERQILETLRQGPMPTGALFGAVSAMEAARFLGDWPFFLRLDALAASPCPLLEGLPAGGFHEKSYAAATVRLTAAGEAVLAGRLDRATALPVDRWLGGTRLGQGPPWRWDPDGRRLARG
jgi:hypothetical protein